jgi:hypothetical protein
VEPSIANCGAIHSPSLRGCRNGNLETPWRSHGDRMEKRHRIGRMSRAAVIESPTQTMWWGGLDSNQRRRTPADLQSNLPVSRAGGYGATKRRGSPAREVGIGVSELHVGFALKVRVNRTTIHPDDTVVTWPSLQLTGKDEPVHVLGGDPEPTSGFGRAEPVAGHQHQPTGRPRRGDLRARARPSW